MGGKASQVDLDHGRSSAAKQADKGRASAVIDGGIRVPGHRGTDRRDDEDRASIGQRMKRSSEARAGELEDLKPIGSYF